MSLLTPPYLQRLGLHHVDLGEDATKKKLFSVVEAHLKKIPFENLAQHGAVGGPVVLDVDKIADKILHRRRGGFCFELNGLLAELLLELGYDVKRVPAQVYMGPDVGFTPLGNHMVLIVTIPESTLEPTSSTWFVDVGFGEPPLNPLRYDIDGTEQQTPEGMMSRFVPSGDSHVVLEWYTHSTQSWMPRLQWKVDSVNNGGVPLEEFEAALQDVQQPSSPFSQKLIVCRLTRNDKVTLAGDNFKRTGPPRFDKDTQSNSVALDSIEQVRQVLVEEFGMPLEETKGLDLSKSQQAPQGLWGQI